jgi:sec-independent protein translocase protein TatB
MPNFTLSEILTIVLVILIVFGPQRLPEMAKKAGQLVRKARSMASDLRKELEGEFGDVTQPLKEVRDELKGVSQDMGQSLESLNDEVAKAKKEIEGRLVETNEEVRDVLEKPEASSTDASVDDTPSGEAAGEQ